MNALASTNVYDRIFRDALGFESLLDTLQRTSQASPQSNSGFPPVNIIRHENDENKYTIELAVSGFRKHEIEIKVEKNSLKVHGKKEENEKRRYVMQGIAYRSFTRSFLLADSVVVQEATLEDGILSIYLENVIPEQHKPRLIPINSTNLLESTRG